MIGKITLVAPKETCIEGVVYKVKIGNKFYIGSTKMKLKIRANKHNAQIKNGSKSKFHTELRNNNIFKVDCQEIYRGTEYLDIENKLIYESLNDKNCLNMKVVRSTKERKRALNNKKAPCKLCDKVIMKKNMARHLRHMHNVSNFDLFSKKVII